MEASLLLDMEQCEVQKEMGFILEAVEQFCTSALL